MLYLLIVLLVFLAIIVYIITNREIMTPSLWLIAGYILCSVVAAINIKYWDEDINLVTIVVVIIGILSFAYGEMFGRMSIIGISKLNRKVSNSNKKVSNYNKKVKVLNIPKLHILFMSIFMVFICCLYFLYTYKLSLAGGNPGGFINMFTYARRAIFSQTSSVTMGPVLQYGLLICKAFAYICAYELISNYFINNKINQILLIPCFLYLIQTLLSGGRTQMMYLFIYVFVLIAVHNKNRVDWSNRGDKAVIKRAIITIAIILIIFRFIGMYFRGSIYGTERTLWGTMSKYIGSSIIALNKYLLSPNKAAFLGEETLYSVYSALNKIGFNFTVLANNLEFVTWKSVSTNIYTALRRYIHDYGYIGMIMIQFFQGIFYGRAFTRIKYRRLMGLPLILYATLIYPVIFSFIEERFIINVLSAAGIETIILIVVMWRVYEKKQK